MSIRNFPLQSFSVEGSFYHFSWPFLPGQIPILCHALCDLSDLEIVIHVHDEIILEAPPSLTVEEVSARMGETPPWAPGLLLQVDGNDCPAFYRKD